MRGSRRSSRESEEGLEVTATIVLLTMYFTFIFGIVAIVVNLFMTTL